MLTEKSIAQLFSSMLPSGRLNKCFESDAEVLEMSGTRLLFTTDEFSAEDMFRENEPYHLGWNIAVGAISDILAAGGSPVYYAHALTVAPHWDQPYLEAFGTGVRDVLRAVGVGFIGGDCGRSELWRCTVSVIGRCEKRISRMGAKPGDRIYISGRVGAGNLGAAYSLAQGRAIGPNAESAWKLQLALRLKEAEVIRRHASACMDTSDGVGVALHTICDLNRCGCVISEIPYIKEGLSYCELAHLPKELLLLGECGEYELLFTIKSDQEAQCLKDAEAAGCEFHPLGIVTESGRILNVAGGVMDLEAVRVSARDYCNTQLYVKELMCRMKRSTKKGGGRG